MPDNENAVSAQVAYDGVALRAGSMEVRTLAPALMAIGQLLQHANDLLNDGRTALAVKVKSDFKRGSFSIDFELVQTFAMAYMFVGADALKTAKEIAEYVGFVTGKELSLIGLLKALSGGTPANTTTLSDGSVEIVIEGSNNTVNVTKAVYRLASNPDVRRAARDMVAPLEADGVETFEVREGRKVIESVRREDLQSFELPAAVMRELAGVDPERVVVLEIIKACFESDLTWSFSDGSGGRIGAVMQDPNFLRRVAANERTFGKGDVLRVRMRSRPYMTAEGLRTEHVIVEVLEEINQPRQQSMMPVPTFQRRAITGAPTLDVVRPSRTKSLPAKSRKSRKGRKR